jgi:hypothetical protein
MAVNTRSGITSPEKYSKREVRLRCLFPQGRRETPMGLTMNEKQAVTKQLALDYKRATKKNKGRILDSLVRLAEYNRSYAARVLRHRVTANVLARGTVA